MKKILSIALCAAAASAFADPTEVELGEVGVTAITTSLSNAIVAVSYDDLAGGTGMVYSNLVKTANLKAGDKLVEFRNNVYTGWVLVEDGGVNRWQELTEYRIDGSGKQINLDSPTADTIRGTFGTGIWLVRQEPIAANGSTNTFYIYGRPATNTTSRIVGGKWNLVGNPTQSEVVIEANKVSNPTYGDQIVLPVPPDGKLCTYIFKGATNGWRRNGDLKDDARPTLPPGLGCWILTAKDATIAW